MDALARNAGDRASRRWCHGLAALWLACGGSAFAQEVVAVPAAHLHHAEGSVAYAPPGDTEWQDVQPRRLLKRGDRLWTDRGSRAELQAGGHAVRLNGETQLVLENVGETATQLSLTQGSIAATVTRMNPGDSFEIGTPNLAFRARQVGDYRIDVDAAQGVTRVAVLSGSAVVYGEKGEALEVRNGQRASFRERNLTRVPQPAFAATDDFDHWVGARRRGEPTVTMPALPATPPAPPAVPLRVAADGAPAAAAPAPTDAQARAKTEARTSAKTAADARARAQAQRAQEEKDKRAAAARRAEDERRQAQSRRTAEEKRLAAARKAEAQKLADDRRRQLARLQEQARREEQAAQARREQQVRRAEEERREQERRDEEVWLRQQQAPQTPSPYPQPVRPAPMGVPGRRIS
jgi:hypothetical protein